MGGKKKRRASAFSKPSTISEPSKNKTKSQSDHGVPLKNSNKNQIINKDTTIGRWKYADMEQRILAYIIDLIVFALPYGLILGAYYPTGPSDLRPQFFITVIGLYLYFLLFTYFNNGQSLGQMIMKVKTMSIDRLNPTGTITSVRNGSGKNLSIKQAAIYSIGKVHAFILFDIILDFIFKKGKQSLSRFTAAQAGVATIREWIPKPRNIS